MKTAIKVNKTKNYIEIKIPNDLIVFFTNMRGDVFVQNRKSFLNEIVDVFKLDLGNGNSDIEGMLIDVIKCVVENESDNLTEVTINELTIKVD